jgi:hypothetical protein
LIKKLQHKREHCLNHLKIGGRLMKKLLGCLLCVLLLSFAGQAGADTLVPDNDPYFNPQWVTPTAPADEAAWLSGLLGFEVFFISKDEDENPLDNVPSSWIYAVLKYGVGAPSAANPDHWAIEDDGDFILELGDIAGLPTGGLSHVSYFGTEGTPPIPEPATMLLLGTGLAGLAGFGRKKFKK